MFRSKREGSEKFTKVRYKTNLGAAFGAEVDEIIITRGWVLKKTVFTLER